jgi:type II secretory pathway pseudopilin PulG
LRKACPEKTKEAGFSLLEIILTILLASILGTILIQAMGTNLFQSSENLAGLKKGFELKREIESITKDYRNWLVDFPDQYINDFKTGYVDTYSGSLNVQGVLNEINPGNDGDIGILTVTVSDADNNQQLTTVFTK